LSSQAEPSGEPTATLEGQRLLSFTFLLARREEVSARIRGLEPLDKVRFDERRRFGGDESLLG
jgi:hypothetical protein